MPSDKGEIVIGVDLDGVCADFYAWMREIAAKWLESPLQDLSIDVSYGLGEWSVRDDSHYTQLHRFAVTRISRCRLSVRIPDLPYVTLFWRAFGKAISSGFA
jgi:hypothetical protein